MTKISLTDMLIEALQPGPLESPAALLAALDAGDGLYFTRDLPSLEAIETDFAVFDALRLPASEDVSRARQCWVMRVRWLLSGLKDWNVSTDKQMKLAAALLWTSKLCGGEAGLWSVLPDESKPSADFIGVVGRLVAAQRISFGSRGEIAPPIWESEFVSRFQGADEQGDWLKVAEMYPRLGLPDRRPNSLLIEMVRCLARYGFDELVRATETLSQFPVVIEVAHALSLKQRMRLAHSSTSARVRFGCAYVTVAPELQTSGLGADDETALSELLISVASSFDEWRKWMATFVTYPRRYPMIHTALGLALARLPYEPVAIYVSSVELYPLPVGSGDRSRSLVTTCLRTFAVQASAEQRCKVWAYAHQVWREWRFKSGTPARHLFEISESALDFAVASYACECMTKRECETTIAELYNQLAEIEFAWYDEVTDCISEWNCLLSLLQPYAHIIGMAEPSGAVEDILSGNMAYYPFDVSTSSYYRIMFDIRAV